jgi:hypothetical protein
MEALIDTYDPNKYRGSPFPLFSMCSNLVLGMNLCLKTHTYFLNLEFV